MSEVSVFFLHGLAEFEVGGDNQGHAFMQGRTSTNKIRYWIALRYNASELPCHDHPLYNQPLKVRRHLYGDDRHEIVVELADSKTQLIPAHWTEAIPLAPGDTLQALVLFNTDSLRALLTMVTSLITQQQPEDCDAGNTDSPIVANVQSGNPTTAHSFVGRPGPASNSSPTVAPARRNR